MEFTEFSQKLMLNHWDREFIHDDRATEDWNIIATYLQKRGKESEIPELIEKVGTSLIFDHKRKQFLSDPVVQQYLSPKVIKKIKKGYKKDDNDDYEEEFRFDIKNYESSSEKVDRRGIEGYFETVTEHKDSKDPNFQFYLKHAATLFDGHETFTGNYKSSLEKQLWNAMNIGQIGRSINDMTKRCFFDLSEKELKLILEREDVRDFVKEKLYTLVLANNLIQKRYDAMTQEVQEDFKQYHNPKKIEAVANLSFFMMMNMDEDEDMQLRYNLGAYRELEHILDKENVFDTYKNLSKGNIKGEEEKKIISTLLDPEDLEFVVKNLSDKEKKQEFEKLYSRVFDEATEYFSSYDLGYITGLHKNETVQKYLSEDDLQVVFEKNVTALIEKTKENYKDRIIVANLFQHDQLKAYMENITLPENYYEELIYDQIEEDVISIPFHTNIREKFFDSSFELYRTLEKVKDTISVDAMQKLIAYTISQATDMSSPGHSMNNKDFALARAVIKEQGLDQELEPYMPKDAYLDRETMEYNNGSRYSLPAGIISHEASTHLINERLVSIGITNRLYHNLFLHHSKPYNDVDVMFDLLSSPIAKFIPNDSRIQNQLKPYKFLKEYLNGDL